MEVEESVASPLLQKKLDLHKRLHNQVEILQAVISVSIFTPQSSFLQIPLHINIFFFQRCFYDITIVPPNHHTHAHSCLILTKLTFLLMVEAFNLDGLRWSYRAYLVVLGSMLLAGI